MSGRIADIAEPRLRARLCPSRSGRTIRLCLGSSSNINLFRYRQGIVDLYAEVANSALDFGVAKQQLHSSQITGAR
jgi:hypothetical protein